MDIGAKLNEIVNRLSLSIQNSNLTYIELEKITAIPKSTLHRYATGQIKKIPMIAIEKIAAAVGVTPAYIMGWDDTPAATAQPFESDYITFPVIGEVAASYNSPAAETPTGDSVDIPRSWLHGREKDEFFVLRVKGDSMHPTYQDGDKVLILRQSTLNYSGHVAVILYDGENASLKKVEYRQGENRLRLIPLNPMHSPKQIEDEQLKDCRIFGIAKALIRNIDN